MLFLFRHIGKSLRSELITHLGTAQPAPSAVWGYLDSRFLETDTSEKASERWESLKQNTGEKVDEYYARIKSEWLLFSRVSGVTLPLPFVSAKFVGGLLPEIKAPLETSCGHLLSKLPLEKARDAALYHESKLSSKSDGNARKALSNKRMPMPPGQAPQSHNPGAKEVKEPLVGRDNSAGGGNSKDGKSGCSYCATRRYRGANKHDDARCWKNPANAHLVPDWYRQRQAEAAAAKASKGQGDGQETVPKAVQSTFMARSVDSAHEGLRVIKASATGSSGRILPVELLVDSGSDLTLISSSSASIMGFKVTPARGLKKLESAGSLGSICLHLLRYQRPSGKFSRARWARLESPLFKPTFGTAFEPLRLGQVVH
ncbi:hypothetical protein Pmar_PMAR007223 [Perkinsus marinus ATCC 50983]|uniref:Peptidase A2 domain-containing protein n=1 Tax=Perkinsus marinus (strain ATCC 50983 / TXsc) TaxID=423536 RepID=C5LWP9_PERM5|nr:hypothetical protein Pmar_PMAR007223 [Perkinsus marinus ATCC 50983]EEQ98844.1 hypothetical protein Pmar_PMAR007223 [Perkinsus marinus ATCC 50983]|eukprot:XP_002766127.1 hypothetical protein Pmar_PMAR007223 [Perkinsus marinus ATCC 50983]